LLDAAVTFHDTVDDYELQQVGVDVIPNLLWIFFFFVEILDIKLIDHTIVAHVWNVLVVLNHF
jgi:hypothetical protein